MVVLNCVERNVHIIVLMNYYINKNILQEVRETHRQCQCWITIYFPTLRNNNGSRSWCSTWKINISVYNVHKTYLHYAPFVHTYIHTYIHRYLHTHIKDNEKNIEKYVSKKIHHENFFFFGLSKFAVYIASSLTIV